MGNINDYLLWRGDIPISKQFKFNEIDSMILSRLSYLRFDKIKLNNKETIESISNKMKDLNDNEFLYNGDKELITYLGKSLRFKNMIISDYIKIDDKESEKQFGAITVHVSNRELYISYIGTDNTIYGWKEDFNMAFMNNVPCQIAGTEYLQSISKKYMFKKLRIGGHSKGGNVAIYSAITSMKKIQNRIIKVYNYDGPGFNEDTLNKYGNTKIIDRIETYLPQNSVIGRMLNRKGKTTILLSLEKGIFQHDIYSWQVLQTIPTKFEKATQASENINKILNTWLNNTTLEQRKMFFNLIFELFYSTEADTFGELYNNLSKNLPKILNKYNEISKEDKEIITQMIKIFAKTYLSIIKEQESNKFNILKEHYKNKGKKKLEELDKKYFKKLKN